MPSTIGCVDAGAFDSAGLIIYLKPQCILWKIYNVWGTPMEQSYKAQAENSWKTSCVATESPTQSLCGQAKPHFTMEESAEDGAVSILKVEFNGSASLPTGTAVNLSAVPQKSAVAVPLSLQSGGSALLPTTGRWLLKLSIGDEECTGLLEPTVMCLPTFVATPSGGCA